VIATRVAPAVSTPAVVGARCAIDEAIVASTSARRNPWRALGQDEADA